LTVDDFISQLVMDNRGGIVKRPPNSGSIRNSARPTVFRSVFDSPYSIRWPAISKHDWSRLLHSLKIEIGDKIRPKHTVQKKRRREEGGEPTNKRPKTEHQSSATVFELRIPSCDGAFNPTETRILYLYKGFE